MNVTTCCAYAEKADRKRRTGAVNASRGHGWLLVQVTRWTQSKGGREGLARLEK